MTDLEKSDMWKKAIEQTLSELQTLRERLQPVPFSSPLWELYHGAYGDTREDVAFLFCPKHLIPEMVKTRRLDFDEKDDYQINFDNLCENLSHQLSFYNATYLTMPYLVLLLEKVRREQDFKWQFHIILNAGIILSTEETFSGQPSLPPEIQTSYELSKELLRDMSKDFLKQNFDQIMQEDEDDRLYLATALLAIFGDPGAALQLVMGSWEQTPIICPECDYFDEDMEDGFYNETLIKEKIVPAESVIGKWDEKSFEEITGVLRGKLTVLSGKLAMRGDSKEIKKNIRGLKDGIGIAEGNPAAATLFGELSAMDNLQLLLAGKANGIWTKPKYKKSIKILLKDILEKDIYKKKIRELSSIDVQKVLYGRWLLYSPELLICIQPFADGDIQAREMARTMIYKLKERGIPILIITSNTAELNYCSGRTVYMRHGKMISKEEAHRFLYSGE